MSTVKSTNIVVKIAFKFIGTIKIKAKIYVIVDEIIQFFSNQSQFICTYYIGTDFENIVDKRH